jgi:hypothetical protein
MATLNLFPARIRFTNADGTLTPEAYRALKILFDRVGGALGDNGVDVFADAGGVESNDTTRMDAVIQSPSAEAQAMADVMQAAAFDVLLPDVVQPVAAHELDFAKARNGLTLPKTSGVGIKVDLDSPAFGWRDLTADIQVRGSGPNDPNFTTYTGTTLRAYQFSAGTMNEVFFVFHVPHDWVPGTDIYFHAHWSNATAVPNTGDVIWSFDYTFAKGFGQEAFPAVSTVSVTAACPATRYTHNISETAAVTIAAMEVDGLILVRGYRDAAAAGDTCTDAVFLHTMDIHYQSSNMSTKNKAPNFYA